jgi:hypothetical protein
MGTFGIHDFGCSRPESRVGEDGGGDGENMPSDDEDDERHRDFSRRRRLYVEEGPKT